MRKKNKKLRRVKLTLWQKMKILKKKRIKRWKSKSKHIKTLKTFKLHNQKQKKVNRKKSKSKIRKHYLGLENQLRRLTNKIWKELRLRNKQRQQIMRYNPTIRFNSLACLTETLQRNRSKMSIQKWKICRLKGRIKYKFKIHRNKNKSKKKKRKKRKLILRSRMMKLRLKNMNFKRKERMGRLLKNIRNYI